MSASETEGVETEGVETGDMEGGVWSVEPEGVETGMPTRETQLPSMSRAARAS